MSVNQKFRTEEHAFTLFDHYIGRFCTVSDSSTRRLFKQMEQVSFRRKDFIIKEGDVNEYLYFCVSGVQRTFFVRKQKEHVIDLTKAPSFCGIGDSYLSRKPSRFYFQALSESCLLRISKDPLEILMKNDAQIAHLFGKVLVNELNGLVTRYYELMSLSMEERFKRFFSRNAHLLNEVSQKDLASFLNMDPTNFSKLVNSRKIDE